MLADTFLPSGFYADVSFSGRISLAVVRAPTLAVHTLSPLPISCTPWHLLPSEPQYSLLSYLFPWLSYLWPYSHQNASLRGDKNFLNKKAVLFLAVYSASNSVPGTQ